MEQTTMIAELREQLKIALEHWEMYEEEFVDVERDAFNEACAVLAYTGQFGGDAS